MHGHVSYLIMKQPNTKQSRGFLQRGQVVKVQNYPNIDPSRRCINRAYGSDTPLKVASPHGFYTDYVFLMQHTEWCKLYCSQDGKTHISSVRSIESLDSENFKGNTVLYGRSGTQQQLLKSMVIKSYRALLKSIVTFELLNYRF